MTPYRALEWIYIEGVKHGPPMQYDYGAAAPLLWKDILILILSNSRHS